MSASKLITRKVEPFASPLGSFIMDKGDLILEVVSSSILIKAVSGWKEYPDSGRNKDKLTMRFNLTLDVDGTTMFVTFMDSVKPEHTERIARFKAQYENQLAQVEAAVVAGEANGNRGLIGLGEGRILRGKFDPWISGLPKEEGADIDKDKLSVVEKVEWRLMPREHVIEVVDTTSIL